MPATTPARTRRSRWVLATVAGAAVVAVTVGVVGLSRDADAPTPLAGPAASVPASAASDAAETETQGGDAAVEAPDPSGEAPGQGDDRDAGSGAGDPGNGADTPGQGVAPPLFGDLPVERRDADQEASPAADVQASVVSAEVVTASGTGIGQVQGEALMVTIEIVNSRGGRLPLDRTTVTAFAGGGAVPASPVDGDERFDPFRDAVLPNESARGTYLFSIPPGATAEEMSVALMYDLDSPVTIFEGPLPAEA